MTAKELQDKIALELFEAENKFPPFHSCHEGFAIMWEEMEELWIEVKSKQSLRDKENIQKECIQIAAMAIRFVLDLEPFEK